MASERVVTSAATPAATQGSSNVSPAQIAVTKNSAQDFEAMALAQMLQPMFNTVDTSKGLVGGGKGEATWKPLLIDEMARMVAKSGGIGIADEVYKELLRMQETAHE